ncbi:RING-H2 finger protein-like protein [Rhynchospora pubera]|uniref:RING-type E3 ubiquitin transferase n=1 Tax=Rhynchospora pubera TaxID=906938 RepID=A0AAV8GE72_9POAL|nr:RING-H2 finger protein-like protein [Rhynchospora pubera]
MAEKDSDSSQTNPIPNRKLPPDGIRQAPPGYAITGQYMLISLLISAALLLLFFILYTFLRHRHMSRRRRLLDDLGQRPQLVFSVRAEPSPNRLDQTVIDSIPVIELPLHGQDTTETCAVCISEFAHGEKVRVLPECGHRFHLDCIDMWFGSHSTCPLCRSDVNLPVSKSDDAVVKLEEAENKKVDSTIHVECERHCSAAINNYSHGSRVYRSALDNMV